MGYVEGTSSVRANSKVAKQQIQGTNPNVLGNNTKGNIGGQVKKLTYREMQARKEKGLCFKCDEVYKPGHRCKFKQIYMIIGDDEWEDKCKEELITVMDGDCAEQLRSRNGYFSTCSKWEYLRNYTKN